MNDENEKKEIREIKETAARYGIRPEAHKPVVVERDGDVVYVAMKETDLQELEAWLNTRQVAASSANDLDAQFAQAEMAWIAPEAVAYRQMLPELLKTHHGKWVALRAGKLIDTDADFRRLAERTNQKFSEHVFTEQVTAQFPREFEDWSLWFASDLTEANSVRMEQ